MKYSQVFLASLVCDLFFFLFPLTLVRSEHLCVCVEGGGEEGIWKKLSVLPLGAQLMKLSSCQDSNPS